MYSFVVPWIDPIDQYAKPPRLGDLPGGLDEWSGLVEKDGDDAIVDGVAIRNRSIDATTYGALALIDSELSGVGLVTDRQSSFAISGSTLVDCDLTGTRLRLLRSVAVKGSRLSGSDLSAGVFSDVVFEDCIFQYTNFRSSTFSRVSFAGCKLEEADFSGAKLTDLSFEGSQLMLVDLLDVFFERVDLRGADSLTIASGGGLSGCLISDEQVQELAYGLALSAGASVERSVRPEQT